MSDASPSKLAGRVLTFAQSGDWNAFYAAKDFLEAQGFSVGRMQGPDPIGLLFGSFDVQKWRNLSVAQRAALHGTIEGNKRTGPVTVRIRNVGSKS